MIARLPGARAFACSIAWWLWLLKSYRQLQQLKPACGLCEWDRVIEGVVFNLRHVFLPRYPTDLWFMRAIRITLTSATTTTVIRLITFCMSRRRRQMYCGHARLCVCMSVCLSASVCPHYCTDPDVTWRRGRGYRLVVHYWANLQSGHGLRCYDNITRTLVTSLRPSRDMTT